MKSYCPKCDKNTVHVTVLNDPFFEYALMCIGCWLIWEANRDAVERFQTLTEYEAKMGKLDVPTEFSKPK